MLPKHKPLRDKKYKDSFKVEGNHVCLLTGAESPDGAHIRQGCFSTGMKPDDNLIIPLAHHLHAALHNTGETEFLIKHFQDFPAYRIDAAIAKVGKIDGRADVIGVIKQIARDYYQEWKLRQ